MIFIDTLMFIARQRNSMSNFMALKSDRMQMWYRLCETIFLPSMMNSNTIHILYQSIVIKSIFKSTYSLSLLQCSKNDWRKKVLTARNYKVHVPCMKNKLQRKKEKKRQTIIIWQKDYLTDTEQKSDQIAVSSSISAVMI